jgi:hypothetical protein
MITQKGYQDLRRMAQDPKYGPRGVLTQLQEALEAKELKPEEFSIKQLYEHLVPDGYEAFQMLDPCNQGSIGIMENVGAVDSSLFSNTSGLLVMTAVMDSYQDPTFIADQLAPARPTRKKSERIGGISQIGDEGEIVGDGQPYPNAGVSETYIDTPVTTKRGMIVSLTKEAVFHDETGVLLENASQVGKALGFSKEKRVTEAVIGETNTYKRNGTATNTYLSSGAYVNIKSSNALTEWTSIEAAELLFANMTDPETGEPIWIRPDTLLVPEALFRTAQRIVGAIEVGHNLGSISNSNFEVRTVGANPVGGGQYSVLTSPYVNSLASSNGTTNWYAGMPSKAFRYNENWPITVVPSPPNSEAEFRRDIINEWKASEKGVVVVTEPRHMVRSTA